MATEIYMSIAYANPFIAISEAASDIEHLATVRDVETYLDERVIQKIKDLELLHKKHAPTYIIEDVIKEIKHLERACSEAYSCDPWKYEPVLLDDLIRLHHDAAPYDYINHIRGLIRAGSWMHYTRKNDQHILDDIHFLQRIERASWISKLQQVEKFYSEKIIGKKLEPAVQTIEYLSFKLWLQLKKFAHAHGLQPTDNNPHLQHFRKEIQYLRIIRDTLYFRLLYPNIASKGL